MLDRVGRKSSLTGADAVDDQKRLTKALVGRYRIEHEIGRGGMATVYLAEDLKHGRPVAIKVMRPELTATLAADRFQQEIRVTAHLEHPHILGMIDSGEVDGLLYVVLPYIEGEDLQERLEREGALPVDEAVRIAKEVADALDYAHSRGVIHRDIKPSNIMLSGGHARITDFGVARAVGEAGGSKLTATGQIIGTPFYMSPEQVTGEWELDGRMDIYALGCVLYAMLTGQPPYTGTSPPEVLAGHLHRPPPSVRETQPEVTPALDTVIQRAMAKEPGQRFDTAGDFVKALKAPETAPPPSVPSTARGVRAPTGTGQSKRRVTGSVIGVAVLALAAWRIVTVMGGQRMERLAVLPLTDLTNDPEQEYVAAGVHEALIAELGQLGLSVTARRTMARYRDSDKGIREIAQELGVDGVIEGSLYRAGDSLEIAARLYDGDERQIWTASFDGVLPNIVALYRGFARAIADQIRLSLSPEDEARLGEAAPVNPAVYEAYLRGMHVLNNRRTREDANTAIDYFNQAVEQNPADPLAYAGLALAYATLGHGFDPPDDAWPRARAAAERAIRLDSTLAEGWAALADYKTYSERDWAGAERAFRRADELNPSLAMNHYHYAWYLVLFGRVDEAVVEHERARELDPLTPLHTTWLPALHWFSGDYERALPQARENVTRYDPGVTAHFVLGETAARLGLYEEAIAAHEQLATVRPTWSEPLGRTYARAGRTEDARRILRQIEAQPPSSWNAYSLALLNAELGNLDEAFRWLEYDPPHAWLAWVVSSQNTYLWKPYQEDPRYQALLRRMNLRYEPGNEHPVPLPVVPPPLSGGSEAETGR